MRIHNKKRATLVGIALSSIVALTTVNLAMAQVPSGRNWFVSDDSSTVVLSGKPTAQVVNVTNLGPDGVITMQVNDASGTPIFGAFVNIGAAPITFTVPAGGALLMNDPADGNSKGARGKY